MEEKPYVEFRDGSRIYFSGLTERGAEDGGNILRGPREVSCTITVMLDAWMDMRPTVFDLDEREPDGSVVIDG